MRTLLAAIRAVHAPATFLLIIPVIGFEYSLRSLRWKGLLAPRRRAAWRGLFPITAGGFFLNNILPFRAGEFARAYWTSRRTDVPISAVFAVLAADRLFDMLALLTFAGGLVFWNRALLPSPAALVLFGTATAGGLLFLLSLAVWPEAWKRVLHRPATPAALARWIGQFIEGTESLRDVRTVAALYAITLSFWVVDAYFLRVIASLFDITLGWDGGGLIILAFCAGAMLPSAPGYVGTLDAAGVAALGYLGYPPAQSLPFVLTVHAVQIAGTVVWGVPSLLVLSARPVVAPSTAVPEGKR